jgi:hydrogenase maturation protein HypF
MPRKMYRIFVKGVVQGVGFRPAVLKTCKKLKLRGFVRNTGAGVEIVVNQKNKIQKIREGFPKLARVDSFEVSEIETREDYIDFKIKESEKGKKGELSVPADLDVCDECLAEMKKEGRRRNYFFTTCTNCGPRYSVLRALPYDRENTAMDRFKMCKNCQKEYEDVLDRRNHAQTIACRFCGPELSFFGKKGRIPGEPLKLARLFLDKDKIVAVKGVGGFQLFCNVKKKTVSRLRRKVYREEKPFALIAGSLEAIRKYAQLAVLDEKNLKSRVKPIVIVKKKGNVLKWVSNLDTLGIMLGSSGLHELLLKKGECLVATSANLPGEPMVIKKDEKLFRMADYILDFNREIINRVDDSIVKGDVILRKSRGMVPDIFLAKSSCQKTILAMGAQLGAAFSIYFRGQIIASPYLGNLETLSSQKNFEKEINKFLDWLKIRPEVVLVDQNPRYYTKVLGEKLAQKWGSSVFEVQHHAAHLYSAVLENHENDNFCGIVCDGTGLGEDGKIWGGEVFCKKKRVGKLEDQWMLLGEEAIEKPQLMLLGILGKFLKKEELYWEIKKMFPSREVGIRREQFLTKWKAWQTSSTGRILDAAASLLAGVSKRSYEGSPAMQLEAFARGCKGKKIRLSIRKEKGLEVLETTSLFQEIFYALKKDGSLKNRRILAATIEEYLGKGFLEIAQRQEAKKIFFSGGVAYNDRIRNYFLKNKVLVNRRIPAGDGGISFGQIGYFLANSGD